MIIFRNSRLSEMTLNFLWISIKNFDYIPCFWVKIFSDYKFKKKLAVLDLKQLNRRKFEYYAGRGSVEDYKEEPFDLKVLKSDLPMYIESDSQVKELQMKIDMYEIIIEYLESVIRMINNRSYQIKNAIEWKSFIEGIK